MYPILSCSNINQLSEFVAHMVPKIWTGTPFTTTSRSNAFRSFCQNIIKSTQISSSCILVALYYIYRLRFAYPSIRGSMGSEVRLFTTALILANKFLDDNTFTNKTWSEVSSVPLYELNIMEMEFLSALQYKTCIHHTQFFSWAGQCQQWMSQQFMQCVALTRKTHHSATLTTTTTNHKKKSYSNYQHPYRRPTASVPTLSWPASYYCYNPAAAATSVATMAAATAMNVNYSNFIPRV